MVALSLAGCHEKDLDPDNPAKSFAIAKEPYDAKHYEMAISRLGEFKSRFPYSRFATEAELLLANSHFELGQYAEATVAYEQFIKLHPQHAQVPYAYFRVGESYWKDAPEAVDREQDLTARAIKEWETLLERYPKSPYAAEAKSLVLAGQRRIAKSEMAIAAFYCKLEIWHACAYRYVALADQPEFYFKDLTREALTRAAKAFEKMADHWDPKATDRNLYVRKMTPQELRAQATALKTKAASL